MTEFYMFSFLSHTFMQYALILGITLAASAALLSPFLVLNHQSMIADGLSHVAFTGIILGMLLVNEPIYFAIPFTTFAALLITYLSNQKMIMHDAAIGVVSAFFLALGLIVVSLSSGFNRSIEDLLTGSILSASKTDVIVALVLLGIIISFVLIFYRQLLSTTYDLTFAKVSKVKHTFLKYFLSALTAVFIVVGVRVVGMLVISAFLIFPTVISAQFSKSFKQTLFYGLLVVVVFAVVAIYISYELDIPTGSTIVVVYTILFVFSLLYRKLIRRNV